MSRPGAYGLLLGLALAVLPGCGRETPTGSVSGKVSYQTTTLGIGTVAFVGSDGRAASGMIQPDGSYTVTGVAVGAAKTACESGTCSSDYPSLKSKAMTLSIVADVFFGVAIVTGIIGLVLPKKIVDNEASSVQVGFAPMPGGGFLSAGGRF